MEKKRVIISYPKAPPDVQDAIKAQYPLGFSGYARKIGGNKPFYGLFFDTEDASYIIKVDVDMDKQGEEVELPEQEAYNGEDFEEENTGEEQEAEED